MSSVRRLSKGSNVSHLEFESDEETTESAGAKGKGLNGMPKRRSSMGGPKSKLNPTEQARIADMYKTVIKLAAENKITAKNSWSLELIDHMGSLIKEDGASDRDNRGAVNFQKASCTLDASVKIYSHRVDDTWSSSFRILENLSRGNNYMEEETEDGAKIPTRVGSKSVSNRLNLTATIEKNISNLNGEALDCSHTADPMFHKMSQAFDEGGAKGMLMANLRVVPDSSSLVFTSDGAETASKTRNTAALIDVTDLIVHSGFSPLSIADLPIAAALQNYRDMIGVEPSTVGCLNTSNLCSSRDPSHITQVASTNIQHAESFDGGDFHCDDDDVDVCDMFGDDFDGGFESVNIRRSSIMASPHRDAAKLTPGTPAKGYDPIYDALGDGEPEEVVDENNGPNAEQHDNKTSIMIPSASAAGNEYSYFDVMSLQTMGCNWAGARHWKRGLRSAIAKSADTAPAAEADDVRDEKQVEEVTTKRSSSKSAAKMPMRINFTQGAVDVSSMLPPKGKRGGDPTSQTAGSIDKAMISARSGGLLLPHDAQFTAKDLCRLFLRPRLIVPPHDLKEHLQPALMRYNADSLQKVDNLHSNGTVSSSLYGEKDFVWGSFAADVLSFNVNQNEPALHMNSNNADDDGPYDDDNGLYEGFGEDDDNEVTSTVDDVIEHMQGLSINKKNLIQAARVVDKVDIGYATVAKRVNVKKLKADLWSHLEESLVPTKLAEENIAPHDSPAAKLAKNSPSSNVMSFQDVISDLAHEQKQKDVSLSFYFICLLHLANEKTLEINAVETMSDLMISKPL